MYNQQQQGMMNQPPYSQTSQPQPNVYIQQMPLQQNRGDGQQNFGDMGGTFNPAGGQQYQRQMSSREMQGGPDVYGYGPTPNQPGGYNVGPNRSANMYVGGLSTVSSPPMVMDQQQHYASQQGNPQQQYGSGVTLHRQSTFPPGAGNVRMVSPEMMGNQYYTAPPGVGPPQQQQQQYSISDFQQAQQQQQPSQTQMNRGQSQMNRPYSMQQAGDMGSPAFVGSPQPQQQQQQAQLPISAPNQTVSVMTSRPGVSVSTTPVGVMSVTQMNAAQYGGSQSVAAGQVRLPLQQSLGKGAGVTVTPSTNQAVTSTGSNSSTRTASQQQPMSTLASLVSGPTPIATQQQQQQPSAVRTAVQPTYLQYLQNSELPQTPYGLCKIAREINHEVMNKTSEVFYSLRSYQVFEV